jgi:hypothetical protein
MTWFACFSGTDEIRDCPDRNASPVDTLLKVEDVVGVTFLLGPINRAAQGENSASARPIV